MDADPTDPPKKPRLPLVDEKSIFMAPRVLASSSGAGLIPLTPRAGVNPSYTAVPKLQSEVKQSSKTRVIAGPKTSEKEKSDFVPGYQDRALQRRHQEAACTDGKMDFDFAKVDKNRQILMAQQSLNSQEYVNGLLKDELIPKDLSAFAVQILTSMNLLPRQQTARSIWGPGKASLIYDFKKSGLLPNVRLQSQSQTDIDAVGVESKCSGAVEKALIKSIRNALNPALLVPVAEEAKKAEDWDDMFADDTAVASIKEEKARHRDRLAAAIKVDEAIPKLPVAVQNIISNANGNFDGSEDEGLNKADPIDDYDECYPGFLETAGIEFDSEGEEDDLRTVSKKRRPNEAKESRRLDKEVGRIQKVMKEKFG